MTRGISPAGSRNQMLKHWARMDYWTAREFSALCVSIDPRDVDDPEFMEAAVSVEFERINQLAVRAGGTGETKNPSSPSRWFDWAQRKQIRVPPVLRNAVELRPAKRDIETREKTTLLKLIYVMARAKYGYDPARAQNPAVQQICKDLSKYCLQVGDETVRKKLREASNEFGDTSRKG
jgi:hypothetical protein